MTVVGSGSLAHALVQVLPPAGYKLVEVVTRSNSPGAKALGRKVGIAAITKEHSNWSGDIVWLAVSDGAIRELASKLVPLAKWKGKIVLHSSGALSSRDLLTLKRRGAHVGSAHPMMTFVPGETPDMAGVVWTLEGDRAAVATAKAIVHALGGRALQIDPKNKPLYHSFGAFLSPLLVVHLAAASKVALGAGIPRRELAALMKPIVERTMANLFAGIDEPKGAGKAFSGPLIRGDVETIRAHLKSLRQVPAARKLYIALLETALKSDLPVKNGSAIGKLLSRSR